jgi:hypothetical protein
MGTVSHVLSIMGLLIALAGMVIPVLISFIPQIGLWFVHRLNLKRFITGLLALIIAGVGFYINRNYGLIIATVVLVLLTILLKPSNLIKSLFKTRHVTTDEVAINGSSEVIGSIIKDVPICWSVPNMVIPRHIVNDQIEGIHVVATYCAMCMSGILYKAEIDGQKLTFDLLVVWRKNLTMYDKETLSIWQQATGECIYGKLKGKKLDMMFYEQTSWDDWKRRHPDTFFAMETEDAPQSLISNEKWYELFKKTEGIDMKGLNKKDTRLDQHEYVFGIEVNGKSKAYPLELMKTIHQVNDRLVGERVFIFYESDFNKAKAYLNQSDTDLYLSNRVIKDNHGNEWSLDGKSLSGMEDLSPIMVEKHWWLGWSEFHPDSQIYQGLDLDKE